MTDKYTFYVMDEDGTYFSVESARLIRLTEEGEKMLEDGEELEDIEYPHMDYWSLSDVLHHNDAYPLPDEEGDEE